MAMWSVEIQLAILGGFIAGVLVQKWIQSRWPGGLRAPKEDEDEG